MEKEWKVIRPAAIARNPIELIGSGWMLITAGTLNAYNTMTASWGTMGVIWNKPVVYCYIRPERYTYDFMEKAKQFTLCFFEEKYREVLNICGTESGRNVNKTLRAGITAASTKSGAVYFQEANIVLECKKIYYQDLEPKNFLDEEIKKSYQNGGYHRMYVGEIVQCLTR